MAVIWSFPGEENFERNPYTGTLVRELRKLGHRVYSPGWSERIFGRCDIIHLHWPQKVVQKSLLASTRSIAMWMIFLGLRKVCGARIVWTVHNVESHNATRPLLERWWMNRLLALIDGIHALSCASLRDACQTYPAIAAKHPIIAPHWTYGDAYPLASPSASEGRPDTIAFLGDLKTYKGLDDFIDAMEQGRPDGRSYVVHGRPDGDIDASVLAGRLRGLIRRGWRLDFVLDRLTDQQMVDRLAKAGLLVLPYRSGENSGLAILAAERGTPLLVTALPAFEPLLEELGPPRVTPIAPPLTQSQMTRAFESSRTVAGTTNSAFIDYRAPGPTVAKISKYYLFLMDRQSDCAD